MYNTKIFMNIESEINLEVLPVDVYIGSKILLMRRISDLVHPLRG